MNATPAPRPAPAPGPRLAEAAAADAAGRHDDAINALALGTQAGDVHCARELGLRLLVGAAAPLLPKEGLGFLMEAAAGGLPEAAARAAALVALGLRAPADWTLALRCLVRGAELGDPSCRRQLLALCEDAGTVVDADAARGAGAGSGAPDWQRLGATLDLGAWRRSPAPQVRSEDPRVCYVEGLLTPAACDYLITTAGNRLERARVYDPVKRQNVVDAHRDNTLAVIDFPNVDLLHVLLQARMSAGCGIPERFMEPPSVLHYAPGEQIKPHFDFVDPATVPDYPAEMAINGQRALTYIAYLNDGYEGGETRFVELGFDVRGRRGDGVFFINSLPDLSPDFRTLHAGRPPTRGEKWIVTQFVRSRPTR